MDLLPVLGLGVLAGLGLAVPLGAIGVLLVQEGAARGWWRGTAAAAGVATTDVVYAAAAGAAGATVAPVVAGWAPWPQVVGGLVLVGLAVRGLAAARGEAIAAPPAQVSEPSWRRLLVFVGLTAINPATLVYFAAVVAAAPVPVASAGGGVVFVLGVGAASLGWQLVLVTAGALLRRGSGSRLRRVTPLVGNGVVALLGLAMALGPLT